MSEPSYFPVDVASDLEFSLIYGALLLVAVLVAKQLEQIAAGLFEPSALPRKGASLEIGVLPRASDLDAVALVRGGVPALAELVRERAFAEGWLVQRGDQLAIGATIPREALLSTALRAALPFARASTAELERASRAVAAKYLAEHRAALEQAGFLRSAAQRALGLAAFGLPSIGILVIGLSRALREATLGHSTAPAAALLFLSVLAFAALGKPRPHTNASERYSLWLQEATAALREDLVSGALSQRDDFLLVIAAYGASALSETDRARVSGRLSISQDPSEGNGG